ncbi:TetR/AcrR family transcriptional regulator [Micromonospora phytophila]|uniref:TetR/AcrR family transcriptional regulator n=1 Tax=Micromonospora phytophila TaxID=709888 RepID=UPI00202E03A1|nr:TetR/AcrR family transcriptional regulator [Micromonospora phytophila]MCM0679188.1 TetR/AcrR family transcriptional regulator [Micromonospora phytophila]
MQRDSTRERIIRAAYDLLTGGGREAVSTRAVCAASGVQSPTIYRLFGDKQGLLDAVGVHGFQEYLSDKANLAATDDPVEDLRRGWDVHVRFGVENPALYALIYGDARPGVETPAARQASAVLAERVSRIAQVGRLRVSEPRAAHLVHAAGCGLTFTLISLPEDERDPMLSTLARESIIATVTTDGGSHSGDTGPTSVAVALCAVAPQLTALTEAERGLLREWMNRIATND